MLNQQLPRRPLHTLLLQQQLLPLFLLLPLPQQLLQLLELPLLELCMLALHLLALHVLALHLLALHFLELELALHLLPLQIQPSYLTLLQVFPKQPLLFRMLLFQL